MLIDILFICLFGLFEKGSHCVTKIGLEYTEILLPQSPDAEIQMCAITSTFDASFI